MTREKPDPGPKATPEEALRANLEALDLIRRIEPLNLSYAADQVRALNPSAEAIATLPFLLPWLEAIERSESGAEETERPADRGADEVTAAAKVLGRGPRIRGELGRTILTILYAMPEASTDDVLDAMRRNAGPGRLITDVTEAGTVTWADSLEGDVIDTARDAIDNRVRRAKESIAKYGRDAVFAKLR